MSLSDKVYLKENGVIVTKSLAVFGDKTFAISNITSVNTKSKVEDLGCIFPISKGAIILGVIIILYMLYDLYNPMSSSYYGSTSKLYFMYPILLIGTGIFFIVYFNRVGTITEQHSIVFVSNAGENPVFSSPDLNFINRIRDAIIEAISDINEVKVKNINSKESSDVIGDSVSSIAVKLKGLKDALDSGLITQQEFDIKKADLLAKM